MCGPLAGYVVLAWLKSVLLHTSVYTKHLLWVVPSEIKKNIVPIKHQRRVRHTKIEIWNLA